MRSPRRFALTWWLIGCWYAVWSVKVCKDHANLVYSVNDTNCSVGLISNVTEARFETPCLLETNTTTTCSIRPSQEFEGQVRKKCIGVETCTLRADQPWWFIWVAMCRTCKPVGVAKLCFEIQCQLGSQKEGTTSKTTNDNTTFNAGTYPANVTRTPTVTVTEYKLPNPPDTARPVVEVQEYKLSIPMAIGIGVAVVGVLLFSIIFIVCIGGRRHTKRVKRRIGKRIPPKDDQENYKPLGISTIAPYGYVSSPMGSLH